MPRKSAAELAASPASPPLAPPRVQPPPGLASDERALFLGIVLGTKAEHFQQADVPLLASYVRACVMEEVASAEIKRALTNGGDASLALKVHERMAKTLYQLSQRLRLNPLSRQPHLSRQSDTKAPALNVYDRLRMERGDGPLAT
jgi:hypothetical protein